MELLPTTDDLLRAAPTLEYREVGAEILVHAPFANKVHVLNASAYAVLQLCDGTRDAQAVMRAMTARAGADAARVCADVAAILAEFETLGLVERGGAA